jgi:cytidine deaminase
MSEPIPSDLLHAATDARRHAHAPYSSFAVGAAVRTADGRVFAGCNVESAAYPLSVCAERNAIAAAVAAGAKRLVEVVVVVEAAKPAAPCGGCRQVIAEFAGGDCRIHAVNLADAAQSLSTTLDELLPHRFEPGDLP